VTASSKERAMEMMQVLMKMNSTAPSLTFKVIVMCCRHFSLAHFKLVAGGSAGDESSRIKRLQSGGSQSSAG
jgi:hypothetical protein